MLPFTMQKQQEDNWCWAAVAVSIRNFLDPDSSPALTQASLATKVLHALNRVPSSVQCTAKPGLCNFTAPLDAVLHATANLSQTLRQSVLTFSSLKAQIDGGRPVCAQIDWFGGGAHAIVLDGYQIYTSGAEVVAVQDPLYGPSLQYYQDLVNDYPPGGVWRDTFTLKP